MRETLRSLSKQVFQLAYFGKLSAEYVSSLEASERNVIYGMLKEQLDDEKKKQDEEAAKIKSQSSKVTSASSAMRRSRR